MALLLGPTTYLGPTAILGDGVSPSGQSFTATAEPADGSHAPRIALTATGINANLATVTRYDSDGSITIVREANPYTVTNGIVGGLFDYEAPFNQPAYYVLQPVDSNGVVWGSSLTSVDSVTDDATTTLDSTQPWLIHPAYPSLSMPVNFVLSEHVRTRDPGGVLVAIPGRPDSIPVRDGTRKYPTGSRTIYTQTEAEEDALLALTADSSSLLAQIVSPTSSRSVYEWWWIGQISETDSGQAFGEPWREWTLPYTRVARPAGTVQALWTYQSIYDNFATYQDLFDAFPTYLALLVGS